MTRWTIGEADIETLLAKRHLEVVIGDAANGEPWLKKATTTLESARLVASTYPSSAYVLGYDAARCVCVGVLAQQGLRPTTDGGHYAVEQAIVAQFRDAFGVFGSLRRGRNRVEYPIHPTDDVTASKQKKRSMPSRREVQAQVAFAGLPPSWTDPRMRREPVPCVHTECDLRRRVVDPGPAQQIGLDR